MKLINYINGIKAIVNVPNSLIEVEYENN